MAIYNYLPKFNYIEPNNLKGLQPGFVVAQEERVAEELKHAATGMFENGKICALTAAGIVKGTADHKVLFIHYSEPLNTMFSGDELFAVNVAEECPRLVQLIPGDEWTSTDANSAIADRIIQVEETKMANGDKGYRYIFLG